jgi:membrane protein DedA with SNARE-associated domain
VDHVLHQVGYGAVFAGIALESLGLPLPGESLLLAASIYAATTQRLDIFVLVPVAAAAAICGDQAGYAIGHGLGYRALARWGSRIGLSDEKLLLGRYLFKRYGAPVVFFGRFVALLRCLAAVLAGANRMPWLRFLFWNALGGITWTCLYGFGAYALGKGAQALSAKLAIVLGVLGLLAVAVAIRFVRRNQARLVEAARRELWGEHALT